MAPSRTDAEQCPGSWAAFVQPKQENGFCWHCGIELTGRRRHWCSVECGQWWQNNHDWNAAREMALKRDGKRCVKCGADGDYLRTMFPVKLEVNHIEPRRGQGYGNGCWNHKDNLETLCHDCHVAVTNQQRNERISA